MNKFKVGDKVKLVKYDVVRLSGDTIGGIGEVIETFNDYVSYVEFPWNGTPALYYNDGLEIVRDDLIPTRIVKLNGLKIVYNPPYTIVTDGTFKGKAKCNPADEYDPIEGLIIAAERLEKAKKPEEVEFKIGDKVRITGKEGRWHDFSKGDTGTVLDFNPHKEDCLLIAKIDGRLQWIDRCDYEHV